MEARKVSAAALEVNLLYGWPDICPGWNQPRCHCIKPRTRVKKEDVLWRVSIEQIGDAYAHPRGHQPSGLAVDAPPRGFFFFKK